MVGSERCSKPPRASSFITAGTPPDSYSCSMWNVPLGRKLVMYGVSLEIRSNRSSGSWIPARPAIAVRWITALVEPPSAIINRIAFSNARWVRTSLGRMPRRTVSTICRPTASAIRSRRASGAGMAAEPDKAIPSASAMAAIVEAVPITVQWPSERLMPSSSSRIASSSIVPARYSAQKRRQSEHAPRLSPRKRPLRCGPPVSMMAGTLALAAPIICAGVVLSQLPSSTTPSSGWARIISSVSMAIRLR